MPSSDDLLNLINTEQSSSIQSSEVSFGDVQTDIPNKVTADQVAVTITAPSYRGERDVTYFRIDLGTLFYGITPTITFGGSTNVSELLQLLNDKYGAQLPSDSLQGVVDTSSSPYTVTFTANSGDYHYSGSVVVADDT